MSKAKKTAFTNANVQRWTQRECERIKRRNAGMRGALRIKPLVTKTVQMNPIGTEKVNDPEP
jgi:hypothetical protein